MWPTPSYRLNRIPLNLQPHYYQSISLVAPFLLKSQQNFFFIFSNNFNCLFLDDNFESYYLYQHPTNWLFYPLLRSQLTVLLDSIELHSLHHHEHPENEFWLDLDSWNSNRKWKKTHKFQVNTFWYAITKKSSCFSITSKITKASCTFKIWRKCWYWTIRSSASTFTSCIFQLLTHLIRSFPKQCFTNSFCLVIAK